MSYEIRKGWPSNGALDEMLVPVEGETLTDGSVAVLDTSTGRWKNGTVAATSDGTGPVHAFVIAREHARNTYTGLMSAAIIEVDSDHYVDATYTPNQPLGVDENGLFKAASSSSDSTDTVVGKVLYYDANNGHLRLFWKPMHNA